MKHMLRLAVMSLWSRRSTALLTVLCIAISVALLLGVEKLRRDGRTAFANTLSGTDLIVGARSGEVQLLLYSIFRIGNATANVDWSAYQRWKQDSRVAWTVPLSLGDSHRGFRVLGTNQDYFKHYRYGRKQPLRFERGSLFTAPLHAVLGADVAKELGYALGDNIALAHGTGSIGTIEHSEHPFEVVGVLARTGTPVDTTVHVSLQGLELIHVGWEDGRPPNALDRLTQRAQRGADTLTPQSITAFLVGARRKVELFGLQRGINTDRAVPMQAVIPGVALQQLWDIFRVAERLLQAVSWLVIVTGIASLLIVIVANLQARRREMAVLRSIGAHPVHVAGLLVFEAMLLAGVGIAAGIAMLYAGLFLLRPLIATQFGLDLPISGLSLSDTGLIGIIAVAAILAGLLPAWRAVKQSLADGLMMKT